MVSSKMGSKMGSERFIFDQCAFWAKWGQNDLFLINVPFGSALKMGSKMGSDRFIFAKWGQIDLFLSSESFGPTRLGVACRLSQKHTYLLPESLAAENAIG